VEYWNYRAETQGEEGADSGARESRGKVGTVKKVGTAKKKKSGRRKVKGKTRSFSFIYLLVY